MTTVLGRLTFAVILGSGLMQAVPSRAEDAAALPFLHAAGKNIVNEKGEPVLLRGCNLGNWLLLEPWMFGITSGPIHDQSGIEGALTKRFGEGEAKRLLDLYRENWIAQRDFDRLKSWNFNVVRLPFHCSFLMDEATGQMKPDGFRWLDHAVSMAKKDGIYVVLDLHGAPGGQSLDGVTGQSGRNQFWTKENRQRGALIWRKVAEHYAAEPTVAAYDLLNEPYGTMNSENHDDDLVGAMDQLIHAIRQVDEKHIVFFAGSFRGIEGYGNPQSRDWKNMGFTEHFYPGLFGGNPTLETHAQFIGSDLASRAKLLEQWNVPYFVGEFNVVLDQAGGADMMRRYYDVFETNGWAATLWAYKLLNRDGGVHPNHWYMVTNREPLTPPDFLANSEQEIEAFCRSLGTMELAQAEDLHHALTAKDAPPMLLGSYSPVTMPARRESLSGWEDADIGDAFPRGGHTVTNQRVQVFGGGRDVYDKNDDFHLVSRPAGGDFTLKADVGLPAATHIYAKAGLMFRASPAPNSPLVMVSLKPNGQCIFAYRLQSGAKLAEEQMQFDAGACTLQLTRRGAAVEAAIVDGKGVKVVSKTASLPGPVGSGLAGMFVLSHDAMLLSEASFGHVEFKGSGTAPATAKP